MNNGDEIEFSCKISFNTINLKIPLIDFSFQEYSKQIITKYCGYSKYWPIYNEKIKEIVNNIKEESGDNVKKYTILNSNGNILYVGGSGPGNYTKIQYAIDDAVDGDTIFVFNDSSPYYENLWVRKSIRIIGEDKNTTVIDGNWNEVYVFRIEADCVEISGFTMINSGNAIEMWSNYSEISNNIITNNVGNGIYLYKKIAS